MSIRTPDWVKHAVFSQIYPDSFAKKVSSHQRCRGTLPRARGGRVHHGGRRRQDGGGEVQLDHHR